MGEFIVIGISTFSLQLNTSDRVVDWVKSKGYSLIDVNVLRALPTHRTVRVPLKQYILQILITSMRFDRNWNTGSTIKRIKKNMRRFSGIPERRIQMAWLRKHSC
jgi:hypothetical protein